MGEPDPLEAAASAARAFAAGGELGVPALLGRGLIHRTYAVRCGELELVVQRLNTEVFSDPDALAENVLRVTEHLARGETRRDPEGRVLKVVRATDGGALHRDRSGGVWRAFAKIRDAEPAVSARDPSALAAAAAAMCPEGGDYLLVREDTTIVLGALRPPMGDAHVLRLVGDAAKFLRRMNFEFG